VGKGSGEKRKRMPRGVEKKKGATKSGRPERREGGSGSAISVETTKVYRVLRPKKPTSRFTSQRKCRVGKAITGKKVKKTCNPRKKRLGPGRRGQNPQVLGGKRCVGASRVKTKTTEDNHEGESFERRGGVSMVIS